MPLNFARLQPDAFAPTRKHPQDAGADVYSLKDLILWPFSYCNVHTGITMRGTPCSALKVPSVCCEKFKVCASSL